MGGAEGRVEVVPVVTIDGPSGVGKGTLSLEISRHYGWHFLDSGALYRLVALSAHRNNVPLDDAERLASLARNLDIRFEAGGEGEVRIFLEGQDVTREVRTEEAGNDASRVAAILDVRKALLQRQKEFRRPPGLVADGRDMGTSVFPDATFKVFLTASPEVRAERRYNQLKQKGLDVNLSALLKEIAERDERDRTRSVSPLKPAADAVVIDTSELGIEEVFKRVIEAVDRRLM